MTEPNERTTLDAVPAIDVRPATEADLEAIYSIWYETETVGIANPPPPGQDLWFRQVFRTGQLVVASDGSGRPLGFAGARRHGPLTVLTDLFVRPAAQSGGIGSALLEAVLPRSGPLATYASTDPRAVASYARRGMMPRWPAYYLNADRDRVGRLRPNVAVRPAGEEGLRFLTEADDDGGGFWSLSGAVSLEVVAGGRVVGAAMITAPSPGRLFRPDAASVVETSALPGHAGETVLAAVAWCLGTESPMVSVQVAGTHEALVPLLELGFRIADVDTACASDERLLADPALTTSFGEPLPAR